MRKLEKRPKQHHEPQTPEKPKAAANPFNKETRVPDAPKGLYLRNGSYRYKSMNNGKKVCINIGFVSLEEAITFANKRNLEQEAGIDLSKQHRQIKTTVKKAIGDFLERKRLGLRENSFQRYRAAFETFLYFIERKTPDMQLSKVTLDHLDEYVRRRLREPIIPTGKQSFRREQIGGVDEQTVAFEIVVIKALFKDALERELIDKNPAHHLKSIPKPDRDTLRSKHNPLEDDQIKDLLLAAQQLDEQLPPNSNAKLYDLFLFFIGTGMREDEVCMLEWSDIDFNRGLIKVDKKTVHEVRTAHLPRAHLSRLKKIAKDKSPDMPLFDSEQQIAKLGIKLFIRESDELRKLTAGCINWKSGIITSKTVHEWRPKGRQGAVPISAQIKSLLLRLHEQTHQRSNFVFAHHDGGRCRIKILDMLKRVQKMARIPGRLRLHDLRHTCAMALRRKKVPLETIMGILRHANIEETLIYAPYIDEEGAAAIIKLDDILVCSRKCDTR